MKSRKGFTLIELLAVIVILAIIALIATPIVLNIIERARVGAAKSSAYGLIDAARLYYTETLMDGSAVTSGNAAAISLAGDKASAGTWMLSGNEIYISGVVFEGNADYTCTGTAKTMNCSK